MPKFIGRDCNNLPALKENIPAFNLSKINVVQLARDLSRQIQTPQPKGWLSKWWTNSKLPYDNNRITLLNEYVEKVIQINQSITQMQYHLYIQPMVLDNLIQGYELEAFQAAELQIAEHSRKLTELEEQKKRDEEETRLKKAQTLKVIGEARMIALQGRLLEKIINELDLDNITPEQAFILVKALNPEANAAIDFASQQLMVEAKIEQMKAQTEKLKHEADYQKEVSRHKRFETDEHILEEKARKNDPGR